MQMPRRRRRRRYDGRLVVAGRLFVSVRDMNVNIIQLKLYASGERVRVIQCVLAAESCELWADG